jgi:lipopolysaccharide transport system permease protein
MNITEQLPDSAMNRSGAFQAAAIAEATAPGAVVTVIEPRSTWRLIDWKEMYEYRDLFRFLVWREIRVRYAQSAVGIGWAVIQPLCSMIVFTIIFSRLANVSSDGVPYTVFNLCALVLWTYFSNALIDGVNCLIGNASMLSKIYFPRMLMPMSTVAARLVDFFIGLILLGVLMAWYRVVPNWGTLFLPLLIVVMVLSASGLSLWLSALAVQYRDVKHAMNFVVQLLMYAAPVVYPASLIPPKYQLLYALNPMVGVIEGCRAALLGTRAMPWGLVGVGAVSALAMTCFGLIYFRNRERLFADVA